VSLTDHKVSQITKLIALIFNFEQNFPGRKITSIHMELFGSENYIICARQLWLNRISYRDKLFV
jgi:hypothetical protein